MLKSLSGRSKLWSTCQSSWQWHRFPAVRQWRILRRIWIMIRVVILVSWHKYKPINNPPLTQLPQKDLLIPARRALDTRAGVQLVMMVVLHQWPTIQKLMGTRNQSAPSKAQSKITLRSFLLILWCYWWLWCFASRLFCTPFTHLKHPLLRHLGECLNGVAYSLQT